MKKKFLILPLIALMSLSACGQTSDTSRTESSTTKTSSNEDTSSVEESKNTTGLPDLPTDLKDQLVIHYHRDDNEYSSWALWLWPEGGAGSEYVANYGDSVGACFVYPLSTFNNASKIGIIVKSKGSWDAKDVNGDRFIDLNQFAADKSGNVNVYVYSGVSELYDHEPESMFAIQTALFLSFTKVDVLCFSGNAKSYKLFANGQQIKSGSFDTPKHEFQVDLDEKADLSIIYTVEVTSAKDEVATGSISIQKLYDNAEFDSLYNYDGELGAIYSSTSTTFKVWSPLSTQIKLRIYDSGTPTSVNTLKGNDAHQDYDMVKGEKGVFSTLVDGDLAGKYYTYIVTNAYYKEKEVVDPYAKGCGINGLRGMIVDFSKTNPEGWDSFDKAKNIDRKALTVYETHIVDVTSSTTWNGKSENAKKFLGLCETGTTYSKDGKSVKTGFDHIKELGVNAVQLQPIFDQANDEVTPSFNWGYNPLNYNCLEGSYSSDAYDGYARIKEFKKVVLDYQNAGINVIMDVVYNHVNSVQGQNFDVLVPYYYFRYSGSELSNGSGCGNETASDHYMFSKFMKDSAAFWLKEYKLGGFRFDLMGLHDLDTMNSLVSNLKEINDGVVVYGEPWTGGSTPLSDAESAKQSNSNKYQGYGQFNDQMRDALIMSGMKGDDEAGFVTNKTSAITSSSILGSIRNGVVGSTYNATNDPDKTLNYASCHDNYTLFDRFTAFDKANAKKDGHVDFTMEEKEKMNILANAMVFTSQGTSFMLAGEEFLRSKGSDLSIAKNSYNASYKVNELDYSLLIEHEEMMPIYQKLIDLKQTFAGLHLAKQEASRIAVSASAIGNQFSYSFEDENYTYKFVHNNGYGEFDSVDLEGYTLYLDTLSQDKTLSASTPMSAYETVIAYKAK